MKLGMIKASEEDKNVFTIAAAKVGSKSFGADGTKYIFTKEALQAHAKSWEGGIITLNHNRTDDGEIIASWFDDETDLVMMKIRANNDETAARIRAGEPTGVSIEAALTDTDTSNNVWAFNGTGVGVIFYPEQPACPLKDGCGILAKDQFEAKMVSASEKKRDNIKAVEYDVARVNDAGDLIKVSEVWTWNDETDTGIEDEITGYVSHYGSGEYSLLPISITKIGDTVAGDATFTVTINIDKPEGGAIMAKDTEDTIPKTEFDAVVAKNEELQAELDAFKADDAIKAKDAELEQLKASNEELAAEINRRDTEIADSLVEEIKAWDEEFVPDEGMELSTIKTIHASIKRATTKTETESEPEEIKASEPEDVDEEVTASNFTAPETGRQKGGLTIGGIVGGKWVGGK